MHYTFYPQGVCSRKIDLDIENGRVHNIHYLGGCNGNLKGISSLLVGMRAEDAIEKLKGIKCGFKNTSCPDQLSIALRQCLEKEAN